jgi:hypothetical protein
MPQIAIKRCHYSTVQHNEQCVTITDPGKGESLGIQTFDESIIIIIKVID